MSSITLLWDDVNLIESGHKVYRDTKPLDIDNLPQLYDTINGIDNFYVDYNYTVGGTYYYIIESIHYNVKSYSKIITITI